MKIFREQMNIGKSKYVVSYHDGVKRHKDGSNFFDVKTFTNKKEFFDFKKKLISQGYRIV